jgi:predicted DNA-binding protein
MMLSLCHDVTLIKEKPMVQITLRVPEEIREMLNYEAVRLGKSKNAVITEVLTSHLGKNRVALEKIKRAVVSARAEGRRTLAESLQLAAKASALDDAEGLGTIKVTRHKARR